jgi:hypothetical protein
MMICDCAPVAKPIVAASAAAPKAFRMSSSQLFAARFDPHAIFEDVQIYTKRIAPSLRLMSASGQKRT